MASIQLFEHNRLNTTTHALSLSYRFWMRATCQIFIFLNKVIFLQKNQLIKEAVACPVNKAVSFKVDFIPNITVFNASE